MRGGPKLAADLSPLPGSPMAPAAFVGRFVVVPKGQGARGRLLLRAWQHELINGVFGVSPRPRLALWSLARGNGKSTLCAALALWALHGDGVEGARVVVVAADERQASLIFDIARRMTELCPELEARTQIYAGKLVVPGTDSTLEVLPAEWQRLQGQDFTLALVDEIGVVDRRCYEALILASGKRAESLVLAVGTPSHTSEGSVMWAMREHALANPDDPNFVFREYAAPAGCAVDDVLGWQAANPALGDFLHLSGIRATLPPLSREAVFRRSRLGQWWEDTAGEWLPVGAWDACAGPGQIERGARVILGLDGSFSQDSTTLVLCTIEPRPRVELLREWSPAPRQRDYRVPVVKVEQAIRDACRKYAVVEIVADPFRWNRSLQLLAGQGLPVVEFPQSAVRMIPATEAFYEAVVNDQLTHGGVADPVLALHVANCTVKTDARGSRLQKSHEGGGKIDAAVTAVMAHSRARWHLTAAPAPKRRMLVLG